jgi:hypothetical protein
VEGTYVVGLHLLVDSRWSTRRISFFTTLISDDGTLLKLEANDFCPAIPSRPMMNGIWIDHIDRISSDSIPMGRGAVARWKKHIYSKNIGFNFVFIGTFFSSLLPKNGIHSGVRRGNRQHPLLATPESDWVALSPESDLRRRDDQFTSPHFFWLSPAQQPRVQLEALSLVLPRPHGPIAPTPVVSQTEATFGSRALGTLVNGQLKRFSQILTT